MAASNIPVRDEIIMKAADGSLFDALFDDYGRHFFTENDPMVALLASTHNEGAVDLLALVTPEALARHTGHNFFQGQRLYEALIMKLDAPVAAMMQAVEHLRVGGGQDYAANLPVAKFAKWVAADPTRPTELLGLADAGSELAERYLSIALKTGTKVDAAWFTDRAYAFLQAGGETAQLGALDALSEIRLAGAAGWKRLFAALEARLTPDPGDRVRSAILRAMITRLGTAPKTRRARLERIVRTALAPLGDHSVFAAAQALAFPSPGLSDALIDDLFDALRVVDPGHKGTIDAIDHALRERVKAGQPAKARALVEHLLTRAQGPLKLATFDSLCASLREAGGIVLEDWVVAWLYGGNLELCDQMNRGLIGQALNEAGSSVDFTRFGLTPTDYPYLARKIIGIFFIKPKLMTSLLVSLLRSAPTGPAGEIEDLLDSVLVNYSGAASDYLRPIAADVTDTASAVAARALARLDVYIDGLKSVGTVDELRPSERERQIEWQRHADQMAKAMGEAHEQSAFAKIFPVSIMLYGTRSVSWIDGGDDGDGITEEPSRLETELSSVGTSWEMPRFEIIDPIGLQFMLRTFRTEKRPS